MLAEKPSNGRVKALSEACLDRTYDESARRYIDTAICKNIQHSLRCYERFCQAQALVYSLIKDDQIKNLDAKTIQLITDKIIEGVLGHMLEDIVIFETKRELVKNSGSGKKSVYKIRFENHEYDILVYDANTNTCEAYEIKHTTEPFPNQYRHLVNEDFVQAAEKRFGQITKRCVFYRDKTYTEENGIEYKNVEEYLCELGE